MDRDQLIHELSEALIERDRYRAAQQDARIKADEAQSRAYELELMLFEPPCLPASSVSPESVTKRVLSAFEHPARVQEVVKALGLTRQQVQTALTRLVRAGKLVRTDRGVYYRKESK